VRSFPADAEYQITLTNLAVGPYSNALERENTVVIFSADQGWCAGHHGVWGKGNGSGPWYMGAGIGTMHYTGMAAFEIQGRIVWDPILVAASIALGAAVGAPLVDGDLGADGLLVEAIRRGHDRSPGAGVEGAALVTTGRER
jgi:hypothetical protein